MLLMLALMALPLCVTFYLSVRSCALEMEMVTEQQSGPFGMVEAVTQRAKLGPDGRAIQSCKFVGLEYFRKVLGLDTASDATNTVAASADSALAGSQISSVNTADAHRSTEFLSALRFTLLYTLVTTPFILGLGFLLALGVNRVTHKLKGFVISASLLPFIITPVVGALAIKWLFRDNGLVWLSSRNFSGCSCIR